MIDWNIPPGEIERRSFMIIDAEAGDHGFGTKEWPIVRRMIHTTADFEFIDSVRFHPRAIESGLAALRRGATIFTDTRMAEAGISKARSSRWGGVVQCLIADSQVAVQAKARGMTRGAVAVDMALPDLDGAIYVVGNAPTALFRLIEHVKAGRADPALVVGLPVGFVNAAESKQFLAECRVPYITALGRKGGSNVAAAVINALAILAAQDQD